MKDIEPKLKDLTVDTIKAVSRKIDPNRRHCSFEVSFSFTFNSYLDLIL